MNAPLGFWLRVAGAMATTLVVSAIGCEQVIGLDGPYKKGPATPAGECVDGASEPCYSGDPALEGIGACLPGTRKCAAGTWGACTGEGSPSIEACSGNDDDCDGNATCTGALGWAISFGGTGADSAAVVASDSANNVIVGATYSAMMTVGSTMLTSVGGTDIAILKLDPAGNAIWAKGFGSTAAENTRGLAVDSGGNIVFISTLGGPLDLGGGMLTPSKASVVIAKLDPNGNHLWSKAFTGATTIGGVDLAVDTSGSVIASMSISGSINFGGGVLSTPEEVLTVVKLDPSGQHVWSQAFGTSKCCGALRAEIATDTAGNIGIAGTFTNTLTIGSTPLTATKRDVFVAKLSPTGAPLWTAQGAAMADNGVGGAAFDKTGAFIVSGTFPAPALAFGAKTITGYATNDAFVAKFNTDGTLAWGKAFGMGGADEQGSEVEADAANNLSFTGTTTSNSLDFGTGTLSPAGMFVVKLDPSGKTLWAKGSEAATLPYPDAAINVDAQGHTLVSRGFTAPFSFAGVNLNSAGMSDIFVVQMGP